MVKAMTTASSSGTLYMVATPIGHLGDFSFRGVEVLKAAGAADRAAIVRERGHALAQRKLKALIDPVWKAAYSAIPEIKDLLS